MGSELGLPSLKFDRMQSIRIDLGESVPGDVNEVKLTLHVVRHASCITG